VGRSDDQSRCRPLRATGDDSVRQRGHVASIEDSPLARARVDGDDQQSVGPLCRADQGSHAPHMDRIVFGAHLERDLADPSMPELRRYFAIAEDCEDSAQCAPVGRGQRGGWLRA